MATQKTEHRHRTLGFTLLLHSALVASTPCQGNMHLGRPQLQSPYLSLAAGSRCGKDPSQHLDLQES